MSHAELTHLEPSAGALVPAVSHAAGAFGPARLRLAAPTSASAVVPTPSDRAVAALRRFVGAGPLPNLGSVRQGCRPTAGERAAMSGADHQFTRAPLPNLRRSALGSSMCLPGPTPAARADDCA